jgi:uncharacterized protein
MIQIGKTNTLSVLRETSIGLYLGDNENTELLLPRKYVPKDIKVGDDIDVFIYKDSEDRLIATTLKPYAEVGEFACLRVKDVSRLGAFLDWGLEKDLMVPFKEQRYKMQPDYEYVVYVYLDELTNRIAASTKINKYISNDHLTVEQGQEVDLLVYGDTDLGYTCIINGKHKGLIYHNDVYQEVQIGDKLKGYIKLIRDNNLLDLSLQNLGFKHVLSSTDLILKYLSEHEGFLDLTDKSSPDIIERRFNMSKATFKKSLGILYRQRKVTLHEDGVRLVVN